MGVEQNTTGMVGEAFFCQNKCSCILKYIPHIFTSVHAYFSHIYCSINVNNAV